MRWWRRHEPEDGAATEEIARVARALEGSPLAGREASAIRLTGDRHVVTVPIDPVDVREAWTAARALVSTTGRWPLAVTSFDSTPIDATIFMDDSAAAAERARTMTAEEGLAALGLAAAELEDLGERLGLDDDDSGFHLEWFEPADQPTTIAFLPTAAPEEAVAYVGLFPWDTPDELAALVAILRGWHERYGAELVAGWSTMLQFLVARPPGDLDAARALAAEQIALASDTITLPAVLPEAHARALVGRREWFLHSRP